MDNNEFGVVGLYDHNATSYRKIKEAFDIGENVVGIIHATGTGKTYNALQLAYDNKDKKITYIAPSLGIIEHIKNIIDSNPNLNLERDFPNLEFRTYQSFINMERNEIENLETDMLIIDEFHHMGAPIWGQRVNYIIDTHPNIKVFGMTAYTVRDRGTQFERDMSNPDSDELFSNKIVSRYDLCDAMIDGVLPKPIYKSAHINLMGLESKLEEKVKTLKASSREKQEYMSILSSVKKKIAEAPSIADVIKKNVKPNGKYIYFCPPYSEVGTNDIETIKKEALEWFKQYIPEEDIVFYTSTSEMGILGKQNREAFYEDKTLDGTNADDKLRVMFAINQYNEGVHAPNIDGVIMGRGTTSDIVYFEQLGRGLSVNGNAKDKMEEYEKYSNEELFSACESRGLTFSKELTKDEIIEKLVSPVIIDLTNNYAFIKTLENNLKDRVRQIKNSGSGEKRKVQLVDATFDIEIENQDLFEMLRYVTDRLTMTWEQKYELAKNYYEYHKDLEIPNNFKTLHGYEYDEDGINLGQWIQDQRKNQNNNTLLQERYDKLLSIGMRFETKDNEKVWDSKYELAKKYHERHGNLNVPSRFKTKNGYEYQEYGISLGNWIRQQKKDFNDKILSQRRIEKLEQLGLNFTSSIKEQEWQEKYELARKYFEYHGNLDIPSRFRTTNGYDFDESGINLGSWITKNRSDSKLNDEKRKKLELIGMRFETRDNEKMWENKYELAKKYFEYHGNLDVPKGFKTINGYEYAKDGVNLKEWIKTQSRNLKITPERRQKLEQLGMTFEFEGFQAQWEKKYELAKNYYEYHHNLDIPSDFRTLHGYEYDEDGTNLGQWIQDQRKNQKNNKLLQERYDKLVSIGMRFETKDNEKVWDSKYELAKKYHEHHGNLNIPSGFKTKNGYEHEEGGVSLGNWIAQQKKDFNDEILSEDRKQKLEQLGLEFGSSINEQQWNDNYLLAKKYFQEKRNLNVPFRFMTTNGYEYDKNGSSLGAWIGTQRKSYLSGTLDIERTKKLLKIGMRFVSKKDMETIEGFCDNYGIDKVQNKDVIEHISHPVLVAKTNYLLLNGVEITDDGKLHEIYSMSSDNMKAKYGLNLEEIVKGYSPVSKKERGK